MTLVFIEFILKLIANKSIRGDNLSLRFNSYLFEK